MTLCLSLHWVDHQLFITQNSVGKLLDSMHFYLMFFFNLCFTFRCGPDVITLLPVIQAMTLLSVFTRREIQCPLGNGNKKAWATIKTITLNHNLIQGVKTSQEIILSSISCVWCLVHRAESGMVERLSAGSVLTLRCHKDGKKSCMCSNCRFSPI